MALLITTCFLACAGLTQAVPTTSAPTSANLAAWEALFSATGGTKWTACNKDKTTPCKCTKNTCDSTGKTVVTMNLVNVGMKNILTQDLVFGLTSTGTTTINFSQNKALATASGSCIDLAAAGCTGAVTCTFPPKVITCTPTTVAPTTSQPTVAVTHSPTTLAPTTGAPVPPGVTSSPTTPKPTLPPTTQTPTFKPTTPPSKIGDTVSPTAPTFAPSTRPSMAPTVGSSYVISDSPSAQPTTTNHTKAPRPSPTVSAHPSLKPTSKSPSNPPIFFSSDAAQLSQTVMAAVTMIVIAHLV